MLDLSRSTEPFADGNVRTVIEIWHDIIKHQWEFQRLPSFSFYPISSVILFPFHMQGFMTGPNRTKGPVCSNLLSLEHLFLAIRDWLCCFVLSSCNLVFVTELIFTLNSVRRSYAIAALKTKIAGKSWPISKVVQYDIVALSAALPGFRCASAGLSK